MFISFGIMVENLASNIPSSDQNYQDILAQTSDSLRQDFLDSHKNKQQEYLKAIKNDKPFSSREPYINYEEIKYIVPIDYTYSRTGEVFRIEMNDGKKYKIRKCNALGQDISPEQRAQEIDENISGLDDLLPQYYGREKEYLLFDWMDNIKSIFENHHEDAYEQLGIMMAKIHAKTPPKENKKVFDRWLKKRTDYQAMAPYFTDEELKIIKQKITTGLANPDLILGLDPRDLTAENVKFTPEGKPIIIDEESINYSIKGIGLGKVMRRKNFDKEKMKSGYESIKNSDYLFTPEFIDFTRLLILLNSLRIRVLNHDPTESIIQEIKDRL